MAAAKIALLLLAAVGCNAAPAPEECQVLAKRLPSKNLHEIYGEWVLVWSVSDFHVGQDLLGNLTSSHVELKLLADNKTIEYNERNIFTNSCVSYFINLTVPSNDGEHHTLTAQSIRVEKDGGEINYNDTGEVEFYESCDDCLLMTYKSSRMKFLLSYRREGSHRDVEQHKAAHNDHKKLSECLGIPHDKPFTYDGVADFCHKKSAPEANADRVTVGSESRMAAAKIALLLLAAIGCNAAPAPEECQVLAKRLPSKNLHEIYSEWVLVWSVSDFHVGQDLLGNLTSCHVEFKLLADNKTIEYKERRRFHNSCVSIFTNLTVPSDDAEHHTLTTQSTRLEKDGVEINYNDTGEVEFYESCDDCLLMTYKSSRMKFLLSYRREGSHRDVEQHKAAHNDHKKLSECLGIPHDKPFTYDGVADFCHKKSAPEANADRS
ncbi:saxitoxin and tetrodotoxin-binding protein 1-like [Gambusia affinis]|uniref:saxitoxin and tetrodotoxin-binding protein 1-like n=1 Tax=Gambusia affinis TaxID=33528 RepID=UPI001CDD5E56|nr:saxitoxin and tetrodotoxin-binding protein 1-like [Gambusia affinis]